jgi:DNA-directed RNA polymerase specialized sigma24 family protein
MEQPGAYVEVLFEWLVKEQKLDRFIRWQFPNIQPATRDDIVAETRLELLWCIWEGRVHALRDVQSVSQLTPEKMTAAYYYARTIAFRLSVKETSMSLAKRGLTDINLDEIADLERTDDSEWMDDLACIYDLFSENRELFFDSIMQDLTDDERTVLSLTRRGLSRSTIGRVITVNRNRVTTLLHDAMFKVAEILEDVFQFQNAYLHVERMIENARRRRR